MEPEGISIVKRALAYLEDTYAEGPGTTPHDQVHLSAHGLLMNLLPESAFLEYCRERGAPIGALDVPSFKEFESTFRADPRFYITPDGEVSLRRKIQ